MVRTASHGFSTFLERCLDQVRQERETEERDQAVEGGDRAPDARKAAPGPPRPRALGFFGSGM